MKFAIRASVMTMAAMIGACMAQTNPIDKTKTDTPAMSKPIPADASLITATGTVRFQDLEGGFWGIVADDGRKFDPIELDEKFHKDGLRVVFEAVPDTDRMSTRMWGSLVVLQKIELEK